MRQKEDTLKSKNLDSMKQRFASHEWKLNIVLNKEDVVTVYSIFDFVEEYKVTIDGEIKKPRYF
jgi:hypothetical protein